MIYFAIQCHNYQKRLCAQLSTLAQQEPAAEIVIDIACLKGNGTPSTEEVVAYFKTSLNLDYHYTDKETFAYRGLTRTQQIQRAKEVKADWIYFADCDHIYPTNFFLAINNIIPPLRKKRRVIFSYEKAHTEVDATEEFLNLLGESWQIPDCFNKAAVLPMIHKRDRRIAAGCMQIVSMHTLNKMGMYYTKRKHDKHLFTKGQRAKSDIVFRRRIGGSKCIPAPYQIHLNHARDKEAGHHLEVQR